jgi:RNA-binding protein
MSLSIMPIPILAEAQKTQLRRLAHSLKPIVLIGNAGLTGNVLAELDQALAHHELLKTRIKTEERLERDAIIEQICEHLSAHLIQRIGHVAVLYRPNPKRPRVILSMT